PFVAWTTPSTHTSGVLWVIATRELISADVARPFLVLTTSHGSPPLPLLCHQEYGTQQGRRGCDGRGSAHSGGCTAEGGERRRPSTPARRGTAPPRSRSRCARGLQLGADGRRRCTRTSRRCRRAS